MWEIDFLRGYMEYPSPGTPPLCTNGSAGYLMLLSVNNLGHKYYIQEGGVRDVYKNFGRKRYYMRRMRDGCGLYSIIYEINNISRWMGEVSEMSIRIWHIKNITRDECELGENCIQYFGK
jgi:hypothetical protein